MVAAIALTALTACGSSATKSDTEAEVATLTSAGPASASAQARSAAQRPRERLDSTPEELEAMMVPYDKCMKERGAPGKDEFAHLTAKQAEPVQAKYDAANKICEPQYYPLPPWERDPTNPESRDFAVGVVKCLKQKGVKYVEVDDDGLSYALGGDQNDKRSITKGMDLIPGCEREVAAKLKK
ncbi:hypothetical protein GCM10010172_18980 [Paractinoplanes ferrugineus]|uniref:Uncharacterized protein n=1 Tax=Paractinoplanes ferrugineus TaxID=113564 RepID=A0A919JBM9_9ACTN|nr:hypothetical protein Afe05nite_85180 [Actinoplanes ferrugineus]